MLKRSMGLFWSTVCYLGVYGGLGAISFLGEFAIPMPVDAEPQWPLMHASAIEFMPQPASSATIKE